MPRSRHIDIALGSISVVLAAAGIIAGLSVLKQQEQLVMASRYNSVFDITQTSNALMRLEADIAAGTMPGLGVKMTDVLLRNAVLINQLKALENSEAALLLRSQPDSAPVLADMRATTDALAAATDPAEAFQHYTKLRSFNRPLMQMVSLAHEKAGDIVLGLQSRLSSAYWLMFGIMLGLVGSSFSLIVLLVRRTKRATRAAFTDTLTGLPNRRAFSDLMREDLASVAAGTRVAMLLIDLDRFKVVNDTLGHGAGDDVLIEVSKRLQRHAAGVNLLVRLGGDEFAMVLIGRGALTRAQAICVDVMAEMAEPIVVGSAHFDIGLSMGIADASAGEVRNSPDDLLAHADLALYAVKAEGRGNARVFTPDLLEAQLKRHELELDLKRAIDRMQFEVWFQPIVDLTSGALIGCEALVRWRHPERGLVSPADFIPIAEETGLIEALGDWVLHEACRIAARWPEPIRVSVNFSVRQLQSHDVLQRVALALAQSGLAPERLELEVTESVLVRDEARVAALLCALRRDGIRIALDDFGTGHASLGYLDRFTFDKIKIDQSFVRTMGSKPSSAAIVKAVTGLAGQLGSTTTAEGIETEEQLMNAKTAGCREGQGFLFSRPLPAAAFEAFAFGAAARPYGFALKISA